MKMRTNNQFKNIRRRLRNSSMSSLFNNKGNNLKPSNCFKCLDLDNIDDDLSLPVVEQEVSTKKRLNFNCLPDDMINIILQYLPIDTRLKILKNKYNAKIMQLKLQDISDTDIKTLFKCASNAEEVLKFVLKKDSDVFTKFSLGAIEWFKEDKELNKYLRFYKENFTNMILAAMKYYTKIYKKVMHPTKLLYNIYTIDNNMFRTYTYHCRKTQDNRNIKVIEEMIFRLYAKLILV